MGKLTQPLKWHGGKHYLAKAIVELMPPHIHYVEPYFGGGSVLLEKNPIGVSEVVNDCNQELMNFWKVLQSPDLFLQFMRVIEATPFSQQEWLDAATTCGAEYPDTSRAAAFFIRCRQSRAGKFDSFATLSKNRTRRAMNEQASAWMTAVAGLPAVAARLKRVVILNDNALNVIAREDSKNTLFYLDPPYLHDTRVTTSDYEHEMTRDAHRQLLDLIRQLQGKVMLSGYPSRLYDDMLTDWNRESIEIDNKASAASIKPVKTECLWMNF